MELIKEGDTVILWLHDDHSSCMLKVYGEQKIGKFKVKVSGNINFLFLFISFFK
jgi:hypothetical protein